MNPPSPPRLFFRPLFLFSSSSFSSFLDHHHHDYYYYYCYIRAGHNPSCLHLYTVLILIKKRKEKTTTEKKTHVRPTCHPALAPLPSSSVLTLTPTDGNGPQRTASDTLLHVMASISDRTSLFLQNPKSIYLGLYIYISLSPYCWVVPRSAGPAAPQQAQQGLGLGLVALLGIVNKLLALRLLPSFVTSLLAPTSTSCHPSLSNYYGYILLGVADADAPR